MHLDASTARQIISLSASSWLLSSNCRFWLLFLKKCDLMLIHSLTELNSLLNRGTVKDLAQKTSSWYIPTWFTERKTRERRRQGKAAVQYKHKPYPAYTISVTWKNKSWPGRLSSQSNPECPVLLFRYLLDQNHSINNGQSLDLLRMLI